MGVYLPNMEMPTKGYRLILVHADGTAQTTDGETTAISVPPHGDLIARDALYTELAKRKSYGELSAKSALRAVANAPTIIPASEEGEA